MQSILLTGNPVTTNIHIENLQINLYMGNATNVNGVTIEERIKALPDALKPNKGVPTAQPFLIGGFAPKPPKKARLPRTEPAIEIASAVYGNLCKNDCGRFYGKPLVENTPPKPPQVYL